MSAKRVFHSFVLALVVLSLVACGATPTAAPAATATTAPAAPTDTPTAVEAPTEAAPTEGATVQPQLSGEISFFLWQNSPGMDELVGKTLPDLFMQLHPGTTVNVTVLPYDQYDQKIALLVSAGTPPDIFQGATDFGRYVEEGVVIPLDEYLLTDPVLGDPDQSRTYAYDLLKIDGVHIYGAQNAALCGMQLYYNQDIFDAAGVEYPSEAWTWDDFLAAAQKLTITDANGEITQYGTGWGYFATWDGGWAPLVWDYGGKPFDSPFNPTEFYFTSEEVTNAWQYVQDLVYKHHVAPLPSVADSLNQAGGPLLSGKAAMVIDGCWMLGPYKNADFTLGMSVVPQGPQGRYNTLWFAGDFAITAASQNKDLAWEYLRWLAVDDEVNRLFGEMGMSCGAPIVRAYDQYYTGASKDIPGGDACQKSLDNGLPATIWHPAWGEILTNIIYPEWDKYIQGTITGAELGAAINDAANAKLAEGQ